MPTPLPPPVASTPPPVANASPPSPSPSLSPPPPQASNPPPPPSSASPPPPSSASPPPSKQAVAAPPPSTNAAPPPPSSPPPSPPKPSPNNPSPVPAPKPPESPPPQPNPSTKSQTPSSPNPPQSSSSPPTSNTTPPPPDSPSQQNSPLTPSPPFVASPPNTNAPPVPSTSPSTPLPSTSSPPGSSSPPPPLDLVSPPPPSVLSPPSVSPPLTSLVPHSNSTNNSSHNASRSSQPAAGAGSAIGIAGTVGVTFVSLLLIGILGIVAWCAWKRKSKVSGRNGGHVVPASIGSSPKSDSGLLKVQTPLPSSVGNSRSLFSYDELAKATNGFSAQNILGEGGFGSVYKANLGDGRVVAVKQLKIGGGQGEREFRSEVEIISRIHHRHLVSLVGYCISDEKRLLLYDFIPNNTLYFHLHGEGRPVMDWATRVKIANGAARGIAYLHEDCHPHIIHRDIKSSNILIDNNFEARVSDFGLAKLADADTHITTHVMGTFGYMAPEYACCGKLTEKSDVYSFGVVLLELVTGRKPVDTSQPAGEESLVEWARPLLNDVLETEQFAGLADQRLEGQYVDIEMFRMIEAAAGCVRHSSAMRPKMSQILRAFDSMVTADLTNGMRVGESEMFDPAKQSAEIRLFQRMAFGCQDYTIDFLSENSWCSDGNHVNSPGDRSAEFPKEFSN